MIRSRRHSSRAHRPVPPSPGQSHIRSKTPDGYERVSTRQNTQGPRIDDFERRIETVEARMNLVRPRRRASRTQRLSRRLSRAEDWIMERLLEQEMRRMDDACCGGEKLGALEIGETVLLGRYERAESRHGMEKTVSKHQESVGSPAFQELLDFPNEEFDAFNPSLEEFILSTHPLDIPSETKQEMRFPSTTSPFGLPLMQSEPQQALAGDLLHDSTPQNFDFNFDSTWMPASSNALVMPQWTTPYPQPYPQYYQPNMLVPNYPPCVSDSHVGTPRAGRQYLVTEAEQHNFVFKLEGRPQQAGLSTGQSDSNDKRWIWQSYSPSRPNS